MAGPPTYKNTYRGLPELLVKKYPELNFEDHCYLRIALDHVFGNQWDLKIHRPAFKHLTEKELKKVVTILQTYLENKPLLLQHHSQSLAYREKWKSKQLKFTL